MHLISFRCVWSHGSSITHLKRPSLKLCGIEVFSTSPYNYCILHILSLIYTALTETNLKPAWIYTQHIPEGGLLDPLDEEVRGLSYQVKFGIKVLKRDKKVLYLQLTLLTSSQKNQSPSNSFITIKSIKQL